ncbi:MAG: phage virion morphogenesis protein [Dechloromonas sp.]|nr:MAG: phage virion morphogenesis protein [Dechloromonas sp.]
MAGASLIVDDAEVLAAFEWARNSLSNLQPLLSDVGDSLVASTKQRFATGKGPNNVPWKALRPRTIKAKGGKTLILVDRNILFSSITYRATANEVEVGTNVQYAAIHQFGGEIQIAARSQKARRRTETSTRKNADGTETVYRKGRFVKLQRKKAGDFKTVRGTEVGNIEIGAHTISIPARPFLGIDEADKTTIVDAVEANILALFGGP